MRLIISALKCIILLIVITFKFMKSLLPVLSQITFLFLSLFLVNDNSLAQKDENQITHRKAANSFKTYFPSDVTSGMQSNFGEDAMTVEEEELNYIQLRYKHLGLSDSDIQKASTLVLNNEIDLSKESHFDRKNFLYNCLKQDISKNQIIQLFEWFDKINSVYLNTSSMNELQTKMKSLTGQTIDADLLRKLTSFDENNQDEIVVFFVSENVRLGSILN
jgi:hypothetical protein